MINDKELLLRICLDVMKGFKLRTQGSYDHFIQYFKHDVVEYKNISYVCYPKYQDFSLLGQLPTNLDYYISLDDFNEMVEKYKVQMLKGLSDDLPILPKFEDMFNEFEQLNPIDKNNYKSSV